MEPTISNVLSPRGKRIKANPPDPKPKEGREPEAGESLSKSLLTALFGMPLVGEFLEFMEQTKTFQPDGSQKARSKIQLDPRKALDPRAALRGPGN